MRVCCLPLLLVAVSAPLISEQLLPIAPNSCVGLGTSNCPGIIPSVNAADPGIELAFQSVPIREYIDPSAFVAGFLNAAVYRRSDGNVSLYYQITLSDQAIPITGGSLLNFGDQAGGIAGTLTISIGYLSYPTLRGFDTSVNQVAPTSINTGVLYQSFAFGFFPTPVTAGASSSIIEVDTNAPWYRVNELVSVLGTQSGYAAITTESVFLPSYAPEPVSALLLALGLLACAVRYRWT